MADAPTVVTPDITSYVDQSFFIEPLGGPRDPQNYLDRFPESVYNKSPDSHLVRFMYTLLGPAGGGWLRKNYLQARLLLEENGIELGSLEDFYGDPLRFGRILEEQYDSDPGGLIPYDQWQEIRAKDARYRNRAVDFVNGARAGNTPLGMQLVARSGLGHDVEIIENYRYLYDQHSDDPLGLLHYGQTYSTEEMVILPRRDLPQQAVQTIVITGTPTGGTFTLNFGGQTTAALAYNITVDNLKAALEALMNIGVGDVTVDGGPLPDVSANVRFTGKLAYSDVPTILATGNFTGGTFPNITVSPTQVGINGADEIAYIPSSDQHALQAALDHIKAVTTIATTGPAGGLTTRTTWNSIYSATSYTEVIRYVTGAIGVPWPKLDTLHWIERAIEHEGPRTIDGLSHHYQNFHNISAISSYTDGALSDSNYTTDLWDPALYKNIQIGPFSKFQRFLYPVLDRQVDSGYEFSNSYVLTPDTKPSLISAVANPDKPTGLIEGIYPIDYRYLPGITPIQPISDTFWASVERTGGAEYLEIDLGHVQAVNYISFEITKKPFDLDVAFDILDQAPSRVFVTAQLIDNSTFAVGHTVTDQNPWEYAEINLVSPVNKMIFTRFIRIGFTRRQDPNSPFSNADGTLIPFSVEVRNLRLGRNVV